MMTIASRWSALCIRKQSPKDCAWLNEHREEIQAYEKNFAL